MTPISQFFLINQEHYFLVNLECGCLSNKTQDVILKYHMQVLQLLHESKLQTVCLHFLEVSQSKGTRSKNPKRMNTITFCFAQHTVQLRNRPPLSQTQHYWGCKW